MFSKNDLTQIYKKGIKEETIKEQLDYLLSGNIPINLIKPATINDGIFRFSKEEINENVDFFDTNIKNKKILKFVPASGSATRMFKTLFNFLETYKDTEKDFLDLIKDKSSEGILFFIRNLKKIPFYTELSRIVHKQNSSIEKLIENKKYKKLINLILNKEGMNLGALPKALIQFHKYTDGIRTAFDEHLVEADMYGKNHTNIAYLHFTVLQQHMQIFKNHLNKYQKFFEKKFDIKYEIDFSLQKSSTDTIAIDMKGKIFRDKNKNLLFRPGGHGSLIENLNDITADIIFIKNIDNVSPDRLKTISTPYKKLMVALLIRFQQKAHQYLHKLNNSNVSADQLNEISQFIYKNLKLIVNLEKPELIKILNRPIRVCGMVINKDEPGGGPFWVKDSNNMMSLQIVEGAQVNKTDKNQANIFASSTHFNPVDIVCYTKNYLGKKFDLRNFVDKNTRFITAKTFKSRKLLALEHPGLWNGSMANWNTIFVEVPAETFNPVKTVSDLLLPSHLN